MPSLIPNMNQSVTSSSALERFSIFGFPVVENSPTLIYNDVVLWPRPCSSGELSWILHLIPFKYHAVEETL